MAKNVLKKLKEELERKGLKFRRQMAAASGKKSTTSLSMFKEAYGFEVEEELSTMATQFFLAEGVWKRKWSRGLKNRMRQIREVQTWMQEQ